MKLWREYFNFEENSKDSLESKKKKILEKTLVKLHKEEYDIDEDFELDEDYESMKAAAVKHYGTVRDTVKKNYELAKPNIDTAITRGKEMGNTALTAMKNNPNAVKAGAAGVAVGAAAALLARRNRKPVRNEPGPTQ
jgi:hypothetical protein